MHTLRILVLLLISFGLVALVSFAEATCLPDVEAGFTSANSVTVESSKDLSNVVLHYCDGSKQKFDHLSGLSASFTGAKKIQGVWVKSGCNQSGDGPGFGEYFKSPVSCEDVSASCPAGKSEVNDANKHTLWFNGGYRYIRSGECLYQELGDEAEFVCEVRDRHNADKRFDVVYHASGRINPGSPEHPPAGSPKDAPAGSPTDLWHYFKEVSIRIEGRGLFEGGLILGEDMGPLYQVGVGAGIHSKDYGGAFWFNYDVKRQGDLCVKKHKHCFPFKQHGQGDINVVFDECPNPPVEVCEFATGSVVEILTSELDEFIQQNQGTKDLSQCNEIVICREGETITVPRFEIVQGDLEGSCPPPPGPECPVQFEDCVQECNESYDIFWANKCIAFCDRHCGIFCDEGDKDCIFDGLEPEVCAQANGFLGQLNILTVVNTSDKPLNAEVYYRNMQGVKAANVFVSLDPQDKRDVFVNELGLQGDTVGSVCVKTDAEEPGRWSGSVTLYKGFEDTIEFALRYPLENAKQGFQVLPLNTFTLGGSGTANWVRLFDAAHDGQPLEGSLFFYNTAGELVQLVDVHIPDGGRIDYPAHEYLGQDATGLALFAPGFDENGDSQKFYYTAARYTYDCVNPVLPFGCADFRTAFVTPSRVPVRGKLFNTLSRQNSTTVAEVFNVMDKTIEVTVTGFDVAGKPVLTKSSVLPPFSNFNFIANEAVEDNRLAYVLIDSGEFYVTAVTSSYVPTTGDVNYGFSFPATRVPGATQHLEFNSFLNQVNDLELVNTSGKAQDVSIVATDYLGAQVESRAVTLAAGRMVRLRLSLPTNSYGTIVVDGEGILARSFVTNPGQYVLPFIGR
jgi:hypothetical protein